MCICMYVCLSALSSSKNRPLRGGDRAASKLVLSFLFSGIFSRKTFPMLRLQMWSVLRTGFLKYLTLVDVEALYQEEVTPKKH